MKWDREKKVKLIGVFILQTNYNSFCFTRVFSFWIWILLDLNTSNVIESVRIILPTGSCSKLDSTALLASRIWWLEEKASSSSLCFIHYELMQIWCCASWSDALYIWWVLKKDMKSFSHSVLMCLKWEYLSHLYSISLISLRCFVS